MGEPVTVPNMNQKHCGLQNGDVEGRQTEVDHENALLHKRGEGLKYLKLMSQLKLSEIYIHFVKGNKNTS